MYAAVWCADAGAANASATATMAALVMSILGRPFDAVDDQNFDRPLRRFELETELLLDGGKEVRQIEIAGRRIGAAPARSEAQLEVPAAFETRPIDDHAARVRVERRRHHRGVQTAEADAAVAAGDAA